MRTKLLTLTIAAALALLPLRAHAPPQKDNPVAVCVVFAFGTVVVIGLWYVCKKALPPLNACNCGCGLTTCPCGGLGEVTSIAPPSGAIVTNPPAPQAKGDPLRLDYDGYTAFGAGSFVDDQGNPWNYGSSFGFALQTSADMTNWQSLTVNGWLTTDSGALISVRSNGVTLVNAYFTAALNPTNGLPIDLPGGPKRFYRIACK